MRASVPVLAAVLAVLAVASFVLSRRMDVPTWVGVILTAGAAVCTLGIIRQSGRRT